MEFFKSPYRRFALFCTAYIIAVIVLSGIYGGRTDKSTQNESVTSNIIQNNISSETDKNTETKQGSENDDITQAEETSVNDQNAGITDTQGAEQQINGTFASEKEDGTGTAGVIAMPDIMYQSSQETGWHFNDFGRWYSTSPGLCYYNGWQTIDGQEYHFSAEGWADLGWKLIGGRSCYFNDEGAYVPDQDNSKLLAFTFDDGPSQGVDELIELCEQTGARLTFFMIGKQIESGGGVIPYLVKNRCELGVHSYTHSNMDNVTPEECAADFAKADELVKQYSGGLGATVCRFPYGNITDANLAVCGFPSIFWDVDTFDWKTQDKESIKNEVYNTISEGNIILMHDRYEASIEACRELFPELIAQGYQLVTVSELAAAKGIILQSGVTYYNFRGFDNVQ